MNEDLFNIIKSRRSIRKYLDKAIPYEFILKILDAGRWAPRAGNAHDIEFVVVRDREKINKLAQLSYGQYWITSAPLVIVLVSDYDRVKRLYGDFGESFSIGNAYTTAENMLLMANYLGLGSCIIGTFDEKELKILLNIPMEKKVWLFITFGYSLETPFVPHRLDLQNLVHFDSYGKKTIY